MAHYVIGIDGGTEGIRAGVFDLAGAPLAFAATPYPTRFPKPSWAEQDPADWWAGLGASVRKAVAEAGIDPAAVIGLSVDTTCCSVCFLDAAGDAVRPALLWMDVRSARECEAIVATGDPALIVNSGGRGPVSAEWMVPKSLWVARNEPESFAKAAIVCEYQDYINLKLTGRLCASINNVSIRWHYAAGRGGYPASLVRALGVEALLEKWPIDVLRLGEVVGGLSAAAAAHLGLRAGLPVAQGGADAFIAMIGLGVVRPGTLAFITGSSHLHLGLSAHAFHGAGIWGAYEDAMFPGLHVVEGGQTSTGSVIAWLKRLLGDGATYDALNAEAAALPPGSDGVICQEHFQGNRTPHTDPASRGAFHGLTLAHGRGHLFRAAIEGVAFGTELIFETMRANGYRPEEIVICGGATRSDLWLKIHADVSGVPLTLTKVPDAPALGSAVLAAVGAGAFGGIEEAAAAMVHVERRIEPDMRAHAAYAGPYAAYKATYGALKSAASA
jgi:ribulose kinase